MVSTLSCSSVSLEWLSHLGPLNTRQIVLTNRTIFISGKITNAAAATNITQATSTLNPSLPNEEGSLPVRLMILSKNHIVSLFDLGF